MILEAKKKELETWDDAAQKRYTTYFGTPSEAGRKVIMGRIDSELAINKDFKLEQFKPIDKADDEPGTFAQVSPSDAAHNVEIGQRMQSAPVSGHNSIAGALAHEMSHFTDGGNTDDVKSGRNIVYGEEPSKRLALKNPALALKNADNFEYYLESK